MADLAVLQASIAYEGSLGGADSEAHRASWTGTRLGGALREVAGPMALSVMKSMAMVLPLPSLLPHYRRG